MKIYETKESEAKIWAFLNLKRLMMTKKKLEKMGVHLDKIKQKADHSHKSTSFLKIREYERRVKSIKESSITERTEKITRI